MFNLYQDGLKQIEISKLIMKKSKQLMHEKSIIEKLLTGDPHNEKLHEKQIENIEKLYSLQIYATEQIENMQKKMLKSGIVAKDIIDLEDDVKQNIDGKSIKDIFKYISGLDEKIKDIIDLEVN